MSDEFAAVWYFALAYLVLIVFIGVSAASNWIDARRKRRGIKEQK